MRRQMRKHYLSKKSFTYEIYAETLKAAHKIFLQKVCLLSGSVLFFMTCSSLHGNYGLTPSPPNVDRSRQRKTRVIFQGRLQLTSARHTPPPHTSATRFLASLRRPALYQPHFGTNGSEQTGLPSWKVAWSYVENFSSYSRSKLIKVDQPFRGVFKRSSNRNTYRNEAFKDIFSCRGKSL